MFHTRKLKPDRSIIGFIYPISILFIFGMCVLFFGFPVALFVIAILFWLYGAYSLYIFLRTGNLGHLVVTGYQAYVGFILFYGVRMMNGGSMDREIWRISWTMGLIAFSVLILYLVITKKIKWRGREIFELAAEPVEETGNGYTPRPRPIAKVEISRKEILAFARFCAKHLIAAVFFSPKQVTFVPVRMGDEYTFMFRSDRAYLETTWISFDFDGDVSVHIAQKDYLEYKEPLAFDKLCESLGQLFIEFAELHQRGEGVRIIDRLDSLRMSYFS